MPRGRRAKEPLARFERSGVLLGFSQFHASAVRSKPPAETGSSFLRRGALLLLAAYVQLLLLLTSLELRPLRGGRQLSGSDASPRRLVERLRSVGRAADHPRSVP